MEILNCRVDGYVVDCGEGAGKEGSQKHGQVRFFVPQIATPAMPVGTYSSTCILLAGISRIYGDRVPRLSDSQYTVFCRARSVSKRSQLVKRCTN